jgi:four helix bundle protein
MFALTSQIRRAVISIPSNIAEGYSRHGTKDYINFVSVAIGSSAELETQILLAQDLGYLPDSKSDVTFVFSEIYQLQKMLHKMRQSLKSKL